jgi:hypothetical protein
VSATQTFLPLPTTFYGATVRGGFVLEGDIIEDALLRVDFGLGVCCGFVETVLVGCFGGGVAGDVCCGIGVGGVGCQCPGAAFVGDGVG